MIDFVPHLTLAASRARLRLSGVRSGESPQNARRSECAGTRRRAESWRHWSQITGRHEKIGGV